MLLPVSVNLEGKSILLVGGGPAAAEKYQLLSRTPCVLTVVAPTFSPEFAAALKNPGQLQLKVEQREFMDSDLDGKFLVFCATEDPALTERITTLCRNRGILVNSADDKARCDFFTNAVIERGPALVAVSTQGRFAGLAAALRRHLEQILPPELDSEWEKLFALRERAIATRPPEERRVILKEIVQDIEKKFFNHKNGGESQVQEQPKEKKPELSEVEIIKANSDFLRGNIARDLYNGSDKFEEEEKQILKFHGLYQQKNRDKIEGEPEKPHTFMLRGRIPGGRLTPDQYLAWDYLAERYGGGTLRLTSRQSIQLHGLLKQDLKTVIQEINRVGLTTMGACGDVVRNVTQALNITGSPLYDELGYYATMLSDYFKFESSAYVEIWLDEVLQNPVRQERIYGKTYLPRKFKIAVCLAGENGVDIYAQDMGFAATHSNGKIDGFFVFAGGGAGMTHNKPETFPRAADLLGWIPKEALLPVATAIVTAHRDWGDRTNRRHARLKYVLADRGVDWFRTEVENRSGVKFHTNRPLPPWKIPEYHGFIRKSDGKYNFGLYIMNGRIRDWPGYRLKTAIAMAVARLRCAIQLTPDQDMLFLDLSEEQRRELVQIFQLHGINTNRPNPLYRRAMACVALPTCALALTEGERYFPHVLRDINRLLVKYNLMDRAPLVRMTGCPNGCARPYS
ncbi:MAG: NADPH-dependent assimilatory sulfite reductase hemoprotein subunit, partial [Turneriella sp.]|nr:NADPH-dependent assimilatory sulfite reductase hemoprotein subunit [Turneriella sp.]